MNHEIGLETLEVIFLAGFVVHFEVALIAFLDFFFKVVYQRGKAVLVNEIFFFSKSFKRCFSVSKSCSILG